MRIEILVKGVSENHNAFHAEHIASLMEHFEELRAKELFGPPEAVKLNFIFDGFKVVEPVADSVAPEVSEEKPKGKKKKEIPV